MSSQFLEIRVMERNEKSYCCEQVMDAIDDLRYFPDPERQYKLLSVTVQTVSMEFDK